MAENFKSIDDALNVETSIVEVEEEVQPIKVEASPNSSIDIEKDYNYARANLYSLIEKGQEAVNGALELAGEGQSGPRAYEVAGQLIKNIGDVVDKLMDLQKKVKDIEEDSPKESSKTVTNNAVFFGSTSEFLKALDLNNRGESK